MNDLDQVRAIRNNLIEQVQELDKYIESNEQKPVLLSATLEGNTITVVFTAKQNIDIHYWHDEKVHSVERYGHDVDESTGMFKIGVNQPEKDWKVQIVADDFASQVEDVKVIEQVEPEPTPEPEPEPTNILIGLWDSWNAPEIDLWKDYASRIDTSKKNMVVQVGNFTKGMTDTDIRNRIKWRLVDGDVLFYLLDDEPFLGSGSLSNAEWNQINDIANSLNIKFGWSLSDNKINNRDFYSEHEMIIPINTYLFFQPDYGVDVGRPYGGMRVETEEEFIAEATRVFDNAREKLPNSKFIFVGQGFYNDTKYRKPPVESVAWTYDFAQSRSDVIGVLWYEWQGKDGFGIKDMPDFYDAI